MNLIPVPYARLVGSTCSTVGLPGFGNREEIGIKASGPHFQGNLVLVMPGTPPTGYAVAGKQQLFEDLSNGESICVPIRASIWPAREGHPSHPALTGAAPATNPAGKGGFNDEHTSLICPLCFPSDSINLP